MARLLDDAADERLKAASSPVTDVPVSLSCWLNSDDTTINQYLVQVLASGSGHWQAIQARGDQAGDPVFAQTFNGGASQSASFSPFVSGTYCHVCGTFGAANHRQIYINGAAGSADASNRPLTGPIDTIIIGDNGETGTRNLSGSIAEIGIWNIQLADKDVISLSKGVSPLLVRPEYLVFYLPCIRDNDEDLIGGISLSVNGTPDISAHPRIFYPSLNIYPSFAIAAPGGGTRSHGYVF